MNRSKLTRTLMIRDSRASGCLARQTICQAVEIGFGRIVGHFEQGAHEPGPSMISRKQKTFRERVRLFRELHGRRYRYKLPKGLKNEDSFLRAHDKIEVGCPTHGWFRQSVTNHQSGMGCPRCGNSVQKTYREHFGDCRRKHGGKYHYRLPRGKKWNDPLKAHAKIKISCRTHGPFIQALNSHKNGIGCPKCGREEQRKKASKQWSGVLQELRTVHGGKYDYPRPPGVRSDSSTIRAHQKIPVMCPDHGFFESYLTNHLRGIGCRRCGRVVTSKKLAHSWGQCLKSFRRTHENRYQYIRPKGRIRSTTTITIICSQHGRFRQSLASHKGGRGCPECGYREGAYTEKYLKRHPVVRKQPANLYLARFRDKTGRESFWKIGISINDPSKRFYTLEQTGGYQAKIVGVIHTTLERAFREEQRILSELSDTGKLYRPRRHFGGHSECFRARSPYQVARWRFKRL